MFEATFRLPSERRVSQSRCRLPSGYKKARVQNADVFDGTSVIAPAASVTRTCAVAARTLKPYAQLSGTRTRAAHRSDIFTSRPRQWPDFHHHQRVTQMIAAARTSKDSFFFFKDSKGNTASSESVSGAATSRMRKLPLLLPSEREASAELSRRRKHFL